MAELFVTFRLIIHKISLYEITNILIGYELIINLYRTSLEILYHSLVSSTMLQEMNGLPLYPG